MLRYVCAYINRKTCKETEVHAYTKPYLILSILLCDYYSNFVLSHNQLFKTENTTKYNEYNNRSKN